LLTAPRLVGPRHAIVCVRQPTAVDHLLDKLLPVRPLLLHVFFANKLNLFVMPNVTRGQCEL
jgi:hypothetical protein